MLHRHLNHQRFTLAAIDDVISRGRWDDWVELRRATLADLALLDKVERVCRPRVSDPYAQRYHFWMHYAEKHRTAVSAEKGGGKQSARPPTAREASGFNSELKARTPQAS